MSNEITLNATVNYADSESANETLQVVNLVKSVSTKKYTKLKQNIGTSEEAIKLGEVTSLGYAILINRDQTNYIELQVGTAGTKFARLEPGGGFCVLRFGSGITAPFAIADTAACQMECLIISQ